MPDKPRQVIAVELFYDGAWHNLVTSDEVFADPIVIQHGEGDESAAPRPASATLRLNNAEDKFRISNPESPLYGKAGVNTPLRITVDGGTRAYLKVASWVCGQSRDFRRFPPRGKAWTDVEAIGTLGQVNQWSELVKSPLRAHDETVDNVVGHWPMEDPVGSAVAASVVSGTYNGQLSGHKFGSQNFPPGSSPVAEVQGFSLANFVCLPGDPVSTDGWQVSRSLNISKLTGGGTADGIISIVLANNWSIGVNLDLDLQLEKITVRDASSTTVASATNAFGTYQWEGREILMNVQAQYSAGTTTVYLIWRGIGDAAWSYFAVAYSGPSSQPATIYTGLPDGSSYGHVIAVSNGLGDLWSDARWDAFTGNDGERAAYRYGRLCSLLNVPEFVSALYDSSSPMGPQRPDTLAKHFREIRDTDDALIYDLIDGPQIYMQSRWDRYNQTPRLTLNARADETGLPSLPAEVTDDLPIHNVVTAQQRGGGEYTARDDTSSMGTQDPPDGRGEYRQTVDVNVADEVGQLRDEAWWYLSKGTIDKPRFPQVVVNLAALGAVDRARVAAVRVGDVIEIINYREYTIRLCVLGYREVITWPTGRMITFNCVPDEVYGTMFVLGTSRLDSGSTTLKTALSPTDTAATFRTALPLDVWDTTAPPVDVTIAGQRCTVTVIGAASLVSGAYDQAVTLIRGVDGIRKPLAAGDPVRLAAGYGRLAL